MPDPFTARGRAGRSRWRRLRWWLAAAVAVVGLAVYLFVFSPLLVVEEVEVTGADTAVARMAQENADIVSGRPLARVDTEAVAERVAADTRIQTVEVSRGWPSSITIEVTLREPEAVLTQPGRPAALVDGSGVAYETVANRPQGLPQIAGPRRSVDKQSLAGALKARSALDPATRREVSAMEISADGDLSFSVGSVSVLWGDAESPEAKAAAVQALLAQEGIDPDTESPLSLDVTAPQTPVVTGLSPAPPD